MTGVKKRSIPNGSIPSPDDETLEKNDNETKFQQMILRDKFLEFSKSLEEEISSVVECRMKSWRELNLPPGVLSWSPSSSNLLTNSLTRTSSSNTKPKKGQLPRREFIARPSLLTELLTVSHFQSVYNLCGAILFILFLQEVMEEVVKTGRIDLRLSYLYWAFGQFDKVLAICICMKLSTMTIIYVSFYFWSHNRHKYPRMYDAIGSLLYMMYLYFFIKLPLQGLLRNQLPPASSIVILCEQVRLFMKTWAFVRTNLPRALRFKKDESKTVSSPCPNFSQYLYFLFAPTLVYRDEYPRNDSCNWGKVTKDLLQVVGCVLYMHFVLTRFCEPAFKRFGQEDFSHVILMKGVFQSCFGGSLVLLCGFFLFLHAWMNAFAEMLRFADRMFYKDWWNSTSYPRFYRTWNCIVHDWLYEYVYDELSEFQMQSSLFRGRLKFLPMLVVFFISSVVHEYILAFAFKFFYPVLLVLFGGFGVLFMFINTKASLFNVFIWVSLVLGTGILMCLYSLEWYARINCPVLIDGVGDYFVPRSWFCTQG